MVASQFEKDVIALDQASEAYSIEELEEVLRRRKKRSTITKVAPSRAVAESVIKIAEEFHQIELRNEPIDEESMYTQVMELVYGPKYFDSIMEIHGQNYNHGNNV
ncbi:hypothetical protein VPHD479_0299 [Vibrio phage D479]